MAEPGRARSLAATVVGWVIAVLVGWWVLGAVFGSLLWLLRIAVMVGVVVGLGALYLWLKRP